MESLGLSNGCFDQFCPSLQKKDRNENTVIERRTCRHCGVYHSTIKAKVNHSRLCRVGFVSNESEEDESEEEEDDQPESNDGDSRVIFDGNVFDAIENFFDCEN